MVDVFRADDVPCPNCGSLGQEGDHYCRVCGTALGDALPKETRAQIDRVVSDRVVEELNQRLKDREVVEVEIAEKVAERTVAWAKLATYFIGIPLALFGMVLGFIGIRTYANLAELTDTIKTTQNTIAATQAELDEGRQNVQTANDQASTLLDQIRSAETGVFAEVEGIRTRLAELDTELRKAAAQLRKRQDELESTVGELIAGRINLDSTVPLEYGQLFADYLAFLEEVGFEPSETEVDVEISKEDGFADRSFYSSNEARVIVGKNLANDPEIALRDYTHHVLLEGLDFRYEQHLTALESALADFYPAGFLDEPRIGRNFAASRGMPEGHMRNLDNDLTFADYEAQVRQDDLAGVRQYYKAGDVIGGLLWELRATTSPTAIYGAASEAWLAAVEDDNTDPGDTALIRQFSIRLFEALTARPEVDRDVIASVWQRRGFPFSDQIENAGPALEQEQP